MSAWAPPIRWFAVRLILVLVALLTPGCGYNAYTIPPAELQRLAQIPPAQRGNHRPSLHARPGARPHAGPASGCHASWAAACYRTAWRAASSAGAPRARCRCERRAGW
jgi:hypothetical protein